LVLLIENMISKKNTYELEAKVFSQFNEKNCLTESMGQIIDDLTIKFKE